MRVAAPRPIYILLPIFGLLWGCQKPGNTLYIYMEPSDEMLAYRSYPKKDKLKFNNISGTLPSGSSFVDAKMRSRGSSDSSDAKRKNFNIFFKGKTEVFPGPPLRKLAVIGLPEDPLLFHELYGYSLYSMFGFFPSRFSVAKLVVNGKPRGISLLVEPAESSLLLKYPDSIALLRSDYDNRASVKYLKPEVKQNLISAAYSDLSRIVSGASSRDLPRRLSGLVNLDEYLRLLSLHRIFRNADYTDETFYSAQMRGDRVFFSHFGAWDLEELFAPSPHRNHPMVFPGGEKALIFAGEAALDRAIARNCHLYSRYLNALEETLSKITDAFLESLEHEVTGKLKEFLDQDELMNYYELRGNTIESAITEATRSTKAEIRDLRAAIPKHRTRHGCGE